MRWHYLSLAKNRQDCNSTGTPSVGDRSSPCPWLSRIWQSHKITAFRCSFLRYTIQFRNRHSPYLRWKRLILPPANSPPPSWEHILTNGIFPLSIEIPYFFKTGLTAALSWFGRQKVPERGWGRGIAVVGSFSTVLLNTAGIKYQGGLIWSNCSVLQITWSWLKNLWWTLLYIWLS